jgi:flavin-dependent dehydrogenase
MRDVVVIGGGPAGATVASLLASFSHDVALVTRASPPAGWLAESIPSSARKLFSTVGMLGVIDSGRFQPNLGNTVWWAGQPERSEAFASDAAGIHAERAALEEALLEEGRGRGVRVHEGAPVRSIERRDGEWSIQHGDHVIRARWVVDASGRAGVVGRGSRREDRPTGTLALVGRWAHDRWAGPGASHTFIESYEDGWAWSVPLSATTRCVTAMVDPRETELEKSADMDGMLLRELAKAPNLMRRLDGATFVGGSHACPASLYTSDAFAGEGHLLVGDAGSFIDPLSSYGVKKAMASAWLAAVTLNTVLTDVGLTGPALEFFAAREREVYRRYRELSVPFFEEAAGAYGTPFWEARAEAARVAGGVGRGATFEGAPVDPADRVDATEEDDALVGHRDVREAYEEIRRRPDVHLTPGGSAGTADLPLVRDQRIVLAPHLISDALPDGIRFVRNVDLLRLVEAVRGRDQVPDIFDAYNRSGGAADLPDFLAALAVSVGKGLLDLSDWRPTAWRRTI